MVGCMKLDENDNSIYHDYFDYEYLKDVLNREIKLILSQDNTTKNILLNNLYELSLSEQFLSSYQDKIEKLINNSYNDEDKQNISR